MTLKVIHHILPPCSPVFPFVGQISSWCWVCYHAVWSATLVSLLYFFDLMLETIHRFVLSLFITFSPSVQQIFFLDSAYYHAAWSILPCRFRIPSLFHKAWSWKQVIFLFIFIIFSPSLIRTSLLNPMFFFSLNVTPKTTHRLFLPLFIISTCPCG